MNLKKTPRVVAVIPARYASTRFPGKPLAIIAGRPMIEWVYRRVCRAGGLSAVLVATDDNRIADCVKGFGGVAVMTSKALPSGTDRMAAALRGVGFDWALNVQGDEPLVNPLMISALVRRALRCGVPSIITAAVPVRGLKAAMDPNMVKVVVNGKGRALYFSRSAIPSQARAATAKRPVFLRHLGIYLYHKKALAAFVGRPPSSLEITEKLEQLRAYELDIPIEVVLTAHAPVNVDVPADVKKAARALVRAGGAKL